MTSGFHTGKSIVADLYSGVIDASIDKQGKIDILQLLHKKGVTPVTFTDWCRLDEFEVTSGQKLGKPREKVTDIKKMLEIMLPF
ncbi:hypothetical protein SK128_024381 [Halocaridina rubra]|uniref:Uncharacterized protein n=1 Tax=Halocaridina rubra TaxID=373956 RepID=A0AAN8WXD4_HALRR